MRGRGPIFGSLALYFYVIGTVPFLAPRRMLMRRPPPKVVLYVALFLGFTFITAYFFSGFFVSRTLSLSVLMIERVSVALIASLIATVVALGELYRDVKSRSLQEKKIEAIEVKAEKEPEKTKFAWDLARVKLEAYFDRNLSQVRMIFFVAVFVMMVGFGFILWGVSHGVTNPESLKTSYLAAISGIITEFIGVTFMVIYRSTMAQANQFMEVLERINTVGMAVQILDAIPDKETQLKNSTRAEIVSLLLSVNARSKIASKRQDAKALSAK